MTQRCPRRQRGETLAGLLVGMTLGLLVLAAGAHLLAQLLRGHRQALQESHLQQDLHFAMDLMLRELQDAQYSAGAWTSRHPLQCRDTFCDGVEDFHLGVGRIGWTLDRNHNGRQDNDECTGYRVSSGALQVRTACTPEVWTPLTDSGSLLATGLQARVDCRLEAGWLKRSVHVQIRVQSPLEASRQAIVERVATLHNDLPMAVQARYCP